MTRLLLTLLLAPIVAFAQYPTKPIHMIIPFAPGGASDFVGRIMQPKMSELLGQPIVVENKPGAVYSLEVGITGTEGVITVDDTHRDIVLATTNESGEGYAPDNARRVDFLGSYPPGDMVLGELRGPMREETEQWLNRICMGLTTQHATAAEAHNRLMLTKAFDKSARLKRPIPLPIDSE